MRRLLFVALLAASFVLGLGQVALADCAPGDLDCSAAPSTTSDQKSGSLATRAADFPSGKGDGDLSTSVAQNKDCKDCQWSVVPACLADGATDSGVCSGAISGCPDPGDIRYRVFMRHGDTGPWILQGTVCLGPDDHRPGIPDIGQVVRERVVNYLPDAAPSFQPAKGGIVNIPTLFASGEPKTMTTAPFDVLGFSVVVTADARWVWSFEPGGAERFDRPGGAYPDDSVAHTYRDGGARQVRVTTYWRARFTVDGEGPFAVPGPEISKTAAPLTVPVREAHSVLVAN
jgi:hypothetical protein